MISLRERLRLLQKAFGKCMLANDGVNVSMKCVNPSCGSRSDPSKLKLTVRLDDERYHCWVCDLKGRRVLHLFYKYAPSYADSAKELFIKDVKSLKQDEDKQEEIKLPNGFSFLANSLQSRDPDIRAVLRYLSSRNISERDLWRYRLGTTKSGRTRRRVIFPSLSDDGDLNYWVARTIDKDKNPKYLNSKTIKKDVIFNEIDLDFRKKMTLVEGPFDLIKCDDNATCLLGSALNPSYALFQEIARFRTPIVLALDSDMPDKTQKIASLLYGVGCDVEILQLGKFSDVGEMSKNEFLSLKNSAKIWNPMDSLLQKISSIKSGSII